MTRVSLAAATVATALVVASGCSCGGQVVPATGDLAVIGDNGAVSHELALDLGDVFPGQTASRTIRLVNHGRASVVVDTCVPIDAEGDKVALAPAPDEAHLFAIEVLNGGVIESEGEVLAIVRFAYPSALPFSGPLREHFSVASLKASSSPGFVRLDLSARVLGCPGVQPARLDFGVTMVGSTARKSLSIANPASFPIQVRLGESSGLSSPEFSIADSLPFTIQPGDRREVTATFQPTASQRYEDIVTFEIGDWCAPSSVSLAGIGVSRLVDWSPEVVDCSWVPVGSGLGRSVTFTNKSRDVVQLSGVQVLPSDQGTIASEFELPIEEWGDGFELAPGSDITKVLRCAPISLGRKHARLTFNLDTPSQPTGEIRLEAAGGGPKIAVEPPTVDFGQVAFVKGATLSRSRSLTIRNVGESPPGEELTTALQLGTRGQADEFAPPYFRIEFEPPTLADEFSIELPPDFKNRNAIPTGTSINAVVRLAPKSAGPKHATLVILSNDFHHPESRISLRADAIELPPCQYRVVTHSLDYGIVHPTSPRTMDFVIENTSNEQGRDCLFSEPTIEGQGFSLKEPFASKLVAAGQKLRVAVTFAPVTLPADEEVPLTGRLRLDASSPSAPSPSGDLRGAVGPACFMLIPGQFNFGTIVPGQRSLEVVPQLVNECNEDITVSSIVWRAEESGFDFRRTESIPTRGIDVSPSDCETFNAAGTMPDTRLFATRFVPQSAGDFQASVTVEAVRRGKVLHYVFPVRGSADATGESADVFIQGGGDPVDILLNVQLFDDEGEPLAAQAERFASILQHAGNDFHLGVIGPSRGWPGPIYPSDFATLYSDPSTPELFLTSASADLATQLALKIAPTAWCGSCEPCCRYYYEGADLLMWKALAAAEGNGPNAEFRRPTARLSLLSVGHTPSYLQCHHDNPSQYQNFWPRPHDMGELAAMFMEFAGPPSFNKLSFGCLSRTWLPNGCAQTGVFEQACHAYAQIMGGAAGNSCLAEPEVWRKRAEMLAESASGMRLAFPLSNPPNLLRAPVEVVVDGVMVPPIDQTGARSWSYDAADNSVRFTLQATPLPGSKVVVRYRPQVE